MTQKTLRDFIAAREAEIREQIMALNEELRELRAAKSAIDGGGNSFGAGAVSQTSPRITHRDMIVSVLDERVNGGTSDKIIEWVHNRYGIEISQASMSSQLSRAKSDNLLVLEPGTKIWRLAKHSLQKNEPPYGGSDVGEGSASSKEFDRDDSEDSINELI